MSSCAKRMRSVKYSSSRKPWAGLPRVLILLLTPSFLHLRFCSHNMQGIPGLYTRAHGVFLSASPDNRDCLFAFVCGVPILRDCVRRACTYGLPHPSYAKGRWSAYRFFPGQYINDMTGFFIDSYLRIFTKSPNAPRFLKIEPPRMGILHT